MLHDRFTASHRSTLRGRVLPVLGALGVILAASLAPRVASATSPEIQYVCYGGIADIQAPSGSTYLWSGSTDMFCGPANPAPSQQCSTQAVLVYGTVPDPWGSDVTQSYTVMVDGTPYVFQIISSPDLPGDPNCTSGSGGGNPIAEIAQLAPCSRSPAWKNHGAYVSAVERIAESFVKEGQITKQQKAQVVSAAARSDCGK